MPGSLRLVLTYPDPEISLQNLPMAQIPPAFILPLLSPLSTILRYPFSQCPSSNLLRGKPRPRAGVLKVSLKICRSPVRKDVIAWLPGQRLYQ
jgi:hypothetical protein